MLIKQHQLPKQQRQQQQQLFKLKTKPLPQSLAPALRFQGPSPKLPPSINLLFVEEQQFKSNSKLNQFHKRRR